MLRLLESDPEDRIPVPCACGCGMPATFIVIHKNRLALEIMARHRGEKHITLLTLGDITDMIQTTAKQAA